MAIALARDGVAVAINYARNREASEAVRSEIVAAGGRAEVFGADATDRDEVRRLHQAVEASLGGVDILVVNATGPQPTIAVEALTWRDVLDQLEFFVKSPLILTRAVLSSMKRRGYGRIINIGSVTSVAGYAGLAPYGASRGGIKQLTMRLADDWGPHGVTVNCLAPGWFKTAQNARMYEDAEWVAMLKERIPARRPGQPGDLDGAVVFLASEESRYVTGQTLLVDGGISVGAVRALPRK